MSTTRKRAIIFGTGRRVAQTIMPSLKCVEEFVEVVAVYGRNEQKTLSFTEKWGVPYVPRRRPLDLDGIDLVVVSITTSNVADVLRELLEQDVSHITLMLDTPIMPFRDFKYLRLLGRFKDVLATEDWIALPTVRIARKLIEDNTIGKVQKIWMMNSGYKHHAIAGMRRLGASLYILSMKRLVFAGGYSEWSIRFPNNVRGVILEPRDYNAGRLLVAGSNGMIADYHIDAPGVHRIETEVEKGHINGFRLNGDQYSLDEIDSHLIQQISLHCPNDMSTHNQLKALGLSRLLLSAHSESNDYRYAAVEALYDSLVIGLCNRSKFFVDPLAIFGGSLIRSIFLGVVPRFMK